MRRNRFIVHLACWLLGTVCGPVLSQAAPDAGALRQQIERDLVPQLPPQATPLAPAEPAPIRLAEGATLTVQAFRFAGNTLLSSEQLQPAVQDYLGRPVGFNDLQQAAQAVAALYRQAGWIVRAYLPAQDVTDGTVTIQVVEAVFSGATVDGEPPQRVDSATVLAHVQAQQAQGAPLSAPALDRALLLADDLPGVTVAGALQPGAREGETALALTVRDESWLAGQASLDNHGARSTGATRARATVLVQSPTRRGDQLRGDLLHSRGSDYARIAYSLPLGADGLRLGVNASHFAYELVGDDFAALNARGDSTSAGLDLSYPLVRSRERNLYLTAELDRRRFENRANGATQSDYAITAGALGLAGNLYDNLGGGGANTATLVLTRGRVAQGTADPGENRALAGSFHKLRYGAARQQVLTPRLSLFGAIAGQHAGKDVDSAERFYLGGPAGVRAYPVNEGGGSRATLLNLELRGRLPAAVTLTGFYDWGRARQIAAGTSTTLKGYGVSVGWQPVKAVDLQATVARRHGRNPQATAAGTDQDGSLHRTRVWLQASVRF